MKHPRINTLISRSVAVFIFSAILSIVHGCGGGGGGQTIAPAPGSPSDSTDPLSPQAKVLLSRFVSGNYESLSDQAGSPAQAGTVLPRAAAEGSPTVTHVGTGTYRIDYGPDDTATALGITYTYTSGHQDVSYRDIFDNLTDTEEDTNKLTVESHDLAYSFTYGDIRYDTVANGTLVFEGFSYGYICKVSAVGLEQEGTLSNGDTFELTVPGSSVNIDVWSYPFPREGETENGTLVYNGETYTYAVYYFGTNLAYIQFAGAYEGSYYVDLYTGTLYS